MQPDVAPALPDPRGAQSVAQSVAKSVVAAGVVALAVAMGIGRFAFTPLLPLMLRDGTLDAGAGAEWAAANYAGYLIGALTAGRMGHRPWRNLTIALSGVTLSTLLVAFVGAGWPGAALRFAAGVFSAWVLVLASGWCLAELARQRASPLGAWIYTGVGLGIALAGLLAWLGGLQPARLLWLELGLLAGVGTAYVVVRMRLLGGTQASPARPTAGDRPRGHTALVLCYGTFGFGYILPATFLPQLAREQVANPLVFGLTWPLFGLAAALSVALSARLLSAAPRRRVWAAAQAAMAIGTGLPALTQSLGALMAAAILVGGTFMVTTMAGLQVALEVAPRNPTPLVARMTAAFAAGQIAGPLLVRLFTIEPVAGWGAMTAASATAATLLILTALWLWFDTQRGSGDRR